MTAKQKLLMAGGVVVLLGSAAALSFARGRERGVVVTLEEVARRDLVEQVTASGFVRARQSVSISSDVSARVAQLAVREGDDVTAGQFLLRLDPELLQAAVARAEAALSQARAQEANQGSNLIRAERDLERLLALHARDSVLVSTQQIQDAETTVAIASSTMESARFGVAQAMASLDEARDRLSKTEIRAPIAGRVTRVNIEEGETAVIGTMNNPGSLLLTISDLSTIEVVVQVDETEVPHIALGDSAAVQIDAFPDLPFSGRVTEIAQSAVVPAVASASGAVQAAVDFQVVITLDTPAVELRPDLSATADIVTETRGNAVSVPIIALTVRDTSAAAQAAREAGTPLPAGAEPQEAEGVFIVHAGAVTFTPVQLGISGQEYFEAVAGLSPGDTVVAGPYQTIRQLQSGDLVRSEAAAAPVDAPAPAAQP